MKLFTRLLLSLAALAIGASIAWADHMNGIYSGTGQAAGISLEIRQRGTTLTGQLSGANQGSLTGQSDGGDNASGMINIVGVGEVRFQGNWTQSGFNLQLIGANNSTEQYFFAAGGSTQTPRTTPSVPPAPPKPAPPPPVSPPLSPVDYYLLEGGQQVGPFTLQQVQGRLANGAAKGEDLVWKTGLPAWTRLDGLAEFATTPPPPPRRDGPPPPPPMLPPSRSDTGTPSPDAAEMPATQPSEMSPQERQQSSMVLGATLGILSHELGHALIGEFKIPSTGPEEDTADEFSALIMSSITTDEEFAQQPLGAQQFLTEMTTYSSLLWFYDSQKTAESGQAIPWYDEHSASDVRFRNTLCMIYGSAPILYKPLADRVGFPDRGRERCEVDYKKRYAAWESIIAPYARNRGGEWPGMLPADAPGAKVTVVYQPSQTQTGQFLQAAFERLGIFEGMAQELQTILAWKRDFQIVFADCGEANAFYDPSKAHVVMCWEGIEHFYWVIAEKEGFSRPATQ